MFVRINNKLYFPIVENTIQYINKIINIVSLEYVVFMTKLNLM